MPPTRDPRTDSRAAARVDPRAAARVGLRIATRAGLRLGPTPVGGLARGLVPALALALTLAACGGASALDESPRRASPQIDDAVSAEPARGEAEASKPRVVWAGEPGEAPRESPTSHARPTYTEADARFMREMIAHHAQALIMTEMVAERTENPTIRLLARRIEVSQADEIELMLRWLADRGEAVPTPEEIAAHAAGIGHDHDGDPDAGDHHHDPDHDHAAMHARPDYDPSRHHGEDGDGHAGMPGMLTADQLAELAAARGEAFDRLFLEFMIYHHEGALIMVDELFAAPGGGQETEIFTFASHVDADQRMEIMRMRQLLVAR